MAFYESSYELPSVKEGSPEAALDAVVDRIEGDDHQAPLPRRPPLRAVTGRDLQNMTPAQLKDWQDGVFERAANGIPTPQVRPVQQRQVQPERPAKRAAKRSSEPTVDEMLDRVAGQIVGADAGAPSQRAPRTDHTADAYAGLNHAELTRRATLFADARDAQRAARQIIEQWNVALAQVAAEFPAGAPNPEIDPPQAWYRWQGHAQALQQLEPYVIQIAADAEERRRAVFEDLALGEDAEFMRRNPDADGDLALHSSNILREHGLDDEQIRAAWNGVGGAALTDPRVQSVIGEAVRFVTGRPLESLADLHSETVKYLREIGFGPDELTALGNGALISLRDHRSQQVLADAARGRMGANR